jgi:hypothetical protein
MFALTVALVFGRAELIDWQAELTERKLPNIGTRNDQR